MASLYIGSYMASAHKTLDSMLPFSAFSNPSHCRDHFQPRHFWHLHGPVKVHKCALLSTCGWFVIFGIYMVQVKVHKCVLLSTCGVIKGCYAIAIYAILTFMSEQLC